MKVTERRQQEVQQIADGGDQQPGGKRHTSAACSLTPQTEKGRRDGLTDAVASDNPAEEAQGDRAVQLNWRSPILSLFLLTLDKYDHMEEK